MNKKETPSGDGVGGCDKMQGYIDEIYNSLSFPEPLPNPVDYAVLSMADDVGTINQNIGSMNAKISILEKELEKVNIQLERREQEIRKINAQLEARHKDLAEERKRAEKAEERNKWFSFGIAIFSSGLGVLLSVLISTFVN